MNTTRQRLAAGAGAAAILTGAAVTGHFVAQPSSPNCAVAAGAGVATIQAAVDACAGGTVQLAAGSYALSDHIAVRHAETIAGAGPTQTFLVQHKRINILQIGAPGVTVRDLSLDTATYFPGVPPVLNNPVPSVLYSGQSHTSVINVTAKAGTGFGLRITGPQPCASYQTTGTVVTDVDVTNTGTGGFAAVDIDCTNGATLSGLTIHGDYLALYQDENVVLNGEVFRPGPYNRPCAPPWYVTAPANHLLLGNVLSYGGRGIAKNNSLGTVTALTIQDNTLAPGDTC